MTWELCRTSAKKASPVSATVGRDLRLGRADDPAQPLHDLHHPFGVPPAVGEECLADALALGGRAAGVESYNFV